MVIPAAEARVFSDLCSSSGTFLIWIILDMCSTLTRAVDMSIISAVFMQAILPGKIATVARTTSQFRHAFAN
jgi:hypothetical protein